MKQPHQLPLFEHEQDSQTEQSPSPTDLRNLGTFQDSMRAPIYGWFRYPAGFSYKLIDFVVDEMGLGSESWVYDPFSGTGTTLIATKLKGINAIGIEAHTFVHWVARVKLDWDFDYGQLWDDVRRFCLSARRYVERFKESATTAGVFPELVYKCYHPQTLDELYLLREFINEIDTNAKLNNLAKLALTDTLRNAAAAGTGWPYIAPNKNTGDKPPKNALQIFCDTLNKMTYHLYHVARQTPRSEIINLLGDSRQKQPIQDEQVDLAITSPPYLNNYDYADRTRLETYFWGITQTWRDITEKYRSKLITAATTQIVRKQHRVETVLADEIKILSPGVYDAIQTAVLSLAEKRLTKGGKKDYDLMVALYFNDMLAVIRETYRMLKPGAQFYLVLGDSAPYGVHIPTESFIGQLGLSLGFRHYEYIEFRKRGKKWNNNPQRHRVQLREGALILTK